VFRSFLGAGSPLFSWLFQCWCHPKALLPGVSSPPILSAEQRHNAPKFQLFPLIISIRVLPPPGFAGRVLSGHADRECGPRSLSDRVGALSDRHLAQSGLRPIVSGLCPIVTWLSQVSVGSCRVSVRSSLGTARPLSDRVGSLSDRHLAQPGLCPIVLGLYLIDILLCLLLCVVCRWPNSFCDLLFGSSFVVDL
jgi:uncharacterized protein YjeT (DUF2065 family)